ncbi:MAG TPA: hypothetical protein ENN13_03080 [Candidatus Altiarchaeales archaeon]|nr:hypothetical protein [Candidatus Altiarchaeales archaeon]
MSKPVQSGDGNKEKPPEIHTTETGAVHEKGVKPKPPNNTPKNPPPEGRYRTKIFGLQLLTDVCRNVKVPYLHFMTCLSPDDFSIHDFPNPTEGRLVIRSDSLAMDGMQTHDEWFEMERTQISLIKDVKWSEDTVRMFMSDWMEKNSPKKLLFIIHKTRPLEDYGINIQLNVDLKERKVECEPTPVKDRNVFRSHGLPFAEVFPFHPEFRFNKDGNVEVSPDPHFTRIFPKEMAEKIVKVLNGIVGYSRREGYVRFETSCVNYKDNPGEPEFYDLIFGKKKEKPLF